MLLMQMVLAVLLVDLARRVRRASTAVAREEPALPEPEPPPADGAEHDHGDSEPLLGAPAPERLAAAGASRTLAGLAVLLTLAALPVWDALSERGSAAALASALIGAAGTELPTSALAFTLGGVGAGLVVRQLMLTAPYGARAAFAISFIASLAYAVPRTYEAAVWRSHQVDAWPVCETGVDVDGNLPSVESIYRGEYDGPRLPSAEPCTLAAERRDQHGELSPRGDFTDGMVQIGSRFPDDRRRHLWGTLGWAVVGALGAAWVLRAANTPASAPRSAGPENTRDADEGDDEGLDGEQRSSRTSASEPSGKDT
jgi:hypothetical protein